jgi:hypothetical protein
MGKYIGFAVMIILILLVLEWFKIFDVPFLKLQDFTVNKEKMYNKSIQAID